MKISLCGTEETQDSILELEKTVRGVVSERSIQVFNSIEDFTRKIRDPGSRIDVAVILAAGGKELQRFIALGELLDGVRVILVLLEDSTETIIQAHQLRPRFIGRGTCDFPIVGLVLQKMMESFSQYSWQEK